MAILKKGNMNKFKLLLFLFGTFLISCKKRSEVLDNNIQLLESLNGSYTGNIYKWNRGYDSSGINIIETFDTVYNVKSDLEIKVANNSIKFGGVAYNYHDDLNLLLEKDTIDALFDLSTLSLRSIKIIKSDQFVRVQQSGYSPNGGPWAYSIMEEYHKD